MKADQEKLGDIMDLLNEGLSSRN